MSNYIVVIGSVTSREYEPFRLRHVSEGIRVLRVPSSDPWILDGRANRLQELLDLASDPSLSSSQLPDFHREFCSYCQIDPGQVVEVVISKSDWDGGYGQGSLWRNWVFSPDAPEVWPNLQHVTVIDRQAGEVEYV